MAVQGVSGVAKDLAKMSSKSAVKLLAPAGGGGLFRWVALLTGSKNAVKGLGFLLGAALLALAGFDAAVLGMAAALTLVLIAVVAFMPAGLPRGRKGATFSEVFSKDRNINWLSAARLFLFGARDVWFVVGIPIYFYSRAVGRHARGPARRLLPDRLLHGAVDHRLRRGAGVRAPPARPASGRCPRRSASRGSGSACSR